MRIRSVATSLVLVLLLAFAAPLVAAPHARDSRWRDSLTRFVHVVRNFVASTTDAPAPPTNSTLSAPTSNNYLPTPPMP